MPPTPVLVEQRFPLELDATHHEIRALYERAKQSRWDPFRDFDWALLERAQFSDEVRQALQLGYSRRLWQEYTALAETPALLIRFCLEQGREADPKYFLAVRNTEEAWHIECFNRIVVAAGGVLPEPSSNDYAQVFNRRRDRIALSADTLLDAYVATYCALEDSIDLELARAALNNARHPIIHAVWARIVDDRSRHAAFGWLYVASSGKRWTAETRAVVAATLAAYINDNVFAGYSCVGLAAPGVADEFSAAEVALEAAGLGGVSAQHEMRALRDVLSRARSEFGALGVVLPTFQHARQGLF